MRKALSVAFAVLLVVVLAVPCFAATAEGDVIMPRYTHIEILTAGLTINEDNGVSTSEASCYSRSGYTVEIVCKLQRQRTNGWTTLKTWTSTGSGYASINQDWAVMSGYTYRIQVTYRILDTNGTVVETASTARYYDYF